MSGISKEYDLFVIGAEMAGTTAANRCAAQGWRDTNLQRAAFAMLHLPMAHLPGGTYRSPLADRDSAHSGWSAPHWLPIHL
ncbi:hypothetical protein E3T34_15005 [Cryobacterium sp. TMT1-62]|nr:hypothetical protein E3N94_11405 [Cryobacterium sp. Sr3]TFD29764.1 hypothetical protein E3T34_15005 [Cryobacterium sp. TMT1-62]